jgi:hypothetical protein
MEVLDLYQRQPWLAEVNASVAHKTELDLDPRWNP